MNRLFSIPDEFAKGWLDAGFNFWRGMPLTERPGTTVTDADGNDIHPVTPGACNIMTRAQPDTGNSKQRFGTASFLACPAHTRARVLP
jgi:hypothetical protein